MKSALVVLARLRSRVAALGCGSSSPAGPGTGGGEAVRRGHPDAAAQRARRERAASRERAARRRERAARRRERAARRRERAARPDGGASGTGGAAAGTGGATGTAGASGAGGAGGRGGGGGASGASGRGGNGGATGSGGSGGVCTGSGDCPGGVCFQGLDGVRRCATSPADPPLRSCEFAPAGCCLQNSQCTQGTAGRCIPNAGSPCGGAAPIGNVCSYDTCTTDASCTAAMPAGATVSVCVPAGALRPRQREVRLRRLPYRRRLHRVRERQVPVRQRRHPWHPVRPPPGLLLRVPERSLPGQEHRLHGRAPLSTPRRTTRAGTASPVRRCFPERRAGCSPGSVLLAGEVLLVRAGVVVPGRAVERHREAGLGTDGVVRLLLSQFV